MKKETFIQADGTPRTKGIANPIVVAMMQATKGGRHRNRKDKRAAQKARRCEEGAW